MLRRTRAFFVTSSLLSLAAASLVACSDDGGGEITPPAATGGGGNPIDPGTPPTDGTGGDSANVTWPSATDAAAEMGRGFNLGQMFESTQHPRTLEAASAKIDAYYDRGFRNVRIPITWTELIGGDLLVGDPAVGDVLREHPRLAVITSVIDYALSKPGLYVVINAHHEKVLKTEARSAVLERLWTDIGEIYADRDPRLLFEFLNEPHKEDTTAMAAADVRLLTGLAYNAVRVTNPNRIVLIGGNQWFAFNEIPAVWTDLAEVGGGSDPYVMATFHHYNPWTFCGDNQGTYDDPWTDADMKTPMETMKQWADTVGGGMPVYIGEWGVGWQSVYSTMECNNIRAWYEAFDSQSAAPLGQPTAVWDDGGWFRLFSHATGQFDSNLIDCLEGSCEWEGDERFNAGCL